MKAVVAAFNYEKALVGAFSVITNLRLELFGALRQAGAGDTELSSAALLLAAATEKIVVLSGPRHRSASPHGHGASWNIYINICELRSCAVQ